LRTKVTVNKIATLKGHNDSVYALTGDNEHFIYSSGADGIVAKWDLTKPEDGVLVAKVAGSVYALHLDQEKNILFIGHNHEGIHVIDLQTNKEIKNFKISNCGAIFDIKKWNDKLLVACQNGTLCCIDLDNEEQTIYKISEQALRHINCLESKIFISSSDHLIHVLNNDLKKTNKLTEATNSVFASLFYEKGLITVSRDSRLRFYSEKLEFETEIVGHIYAINHIVRSPNKKYLATASMDKTIKIWDLEAQKLLKVIDAGRHNGHKNSVNKLFWSRYSDLLVTCSDDRTLAVWDLNFDIPIDQL